MKIFMIVTVVIIFIIFTLVGYSACVMASRADEEAERINSVAGQKCDEE